MSRMRLLTIAFFAVAAAIVAPSAKADTFQYHVTVPGLLDVTFDLPSFENPANDITTFEPSATFDGMSVLAFGISGNSSGCSDGTDSSSTAPCWVVRTSTVFGVDAGTPSFSGPGTFSANGTTVTITDIPSSPTPEPTSLLLMGSGLLGLAGWLRRK